MIVVPVKEGENIEKALQIENKMNRNKVTDFDSNNFFMFKAPKIK